jgi:hypothetical protein
MKIEIEIKKVEKLSKKEINFMNNTRLREYGKDSQVDFKKEDKGATFFIVKDNNKVVAFGMLKPVSVEYLNKKYNILGMGRGIAIIKGKEYGRILQAARIYYLKKTGKTSLAFTGEHNLVFFEKAGFSIAKNIMGRLRYKNPKTGEIIKDDDGAGVYYEGKDKLISKILSGKGLAYTNTPFW